MTKRVNRLMVHASSTDALELLVSNSGEARKWPTSREITISFSPANLFSANFLGPTVGVDLLRSLTPTNYPPPPYLNIA